MRTVTSSLARNAGWWSVGQALSIGCQAGYFIVVARLLGSREYGLFVGAVAMSAILSRAATLGSPFVLLRYVSCEPRTFSAYWGIVLVNSLIFGSLSVIFLTIFGQSLAHSYSRSLLLYVSLSDCLFMQIAASGVFVFQAFERMRFAALLASLVSVLRMALAAVFLWSAEILTAVHWAFASMCVSFLVALLTIGLVTKEYGWPSFSARLWRHRAAEGGVFALSGSTTAVYNDIDKALLGHYGFNTDNGIYAVAYRILDVCTVPIVSVHAAAFPRLFRSGTLGPANSAALSVRILKRTAPMSIVCSAGLLAVAPLIPYVLGPAFTQSISALNWLCVLPLLRSLQLAAGDAVTACGHQNARFVVQLAAAVFNISANIYLIPRFSWLGAAWSSIATDALLAGLNWFVLSRLVSGKSFSEGDQVLPEPGQRASAFAETSPPDASASPDL